MMMEDTQPLLPQGTSHDDMPVYCSVSAVDILSLFTVGYLNDGCASLLLYVAVRIFWNEKKSFSSAMSK
jgi:hypothetical protein